MREGQGDRTLVPVKKKVGQGSCPPVPKKEEIEYDSSL